MSKQSDNLTGSRILCLTAMKSRVSVKTFYCLQVSQEGEDEFKQTHMMNGLTFFLVFQGPVLKPCNYTMLSHEIFASKIQTHIMATIY
jgi:hypothetical protein